MGIMIEVIVRQNAGHQKMEKYKKMQYRGNFIRFEQPVYINIES